MRRPAGSSSAAALAMAILLGVLVLMALVMDGGEKTGAPAIAAGRRMLVGAADAGQMRTLEDFKADDPFQDSKRRVPNGPDPIHNRYCKACFILSLLILICVSNFCSKY
uniref:CLE family OsCLE306 protein n=1 Tax=Oryza sativa subsp. japonica TaxID=39947 RepID=A8R3N5_ORYSJ|nr:CLE family OsCLE306 protein [Oryza sativa Japonica Group]